MGVPRGPEDPTGPLKPGTSITITSPSYDPLVEGEIPETSSGSLDQRDTDISNKEFRYNPPIHSANLHRRVDFGGKLPVNVYREGALNQDYTEKWASKNLNDLRLGRIIQHHQAPGHTANMKYRWGFRFLYNPTAVTIAASRNNSFVIDGRSETNRVLSGVNQNFQNITISLLLDRVPDVMSDRIKPSDYSPTLRSGDADGLRRYGTHWDLEALFKVCNGEWDLMDRGKSSNIGVLIPSNARLILGKGDNLYGFVESVSYTDIMFSQEMVPIRTQVSISFRRHVDMTPEQIEESFPGLGSIGTGEEDSGSAPSDDGSYSGTVGNNVDAPVPGWNKVTTGFYGYKDHNGWDYGRKGIYGQPVHATRGGRIDRIRHLTTSYGKHVYISSGKILMIYAHMKEINPYLREGQVVKAGHYIGRVGNTGNVRPPPSASNPTAGAHLHYEERLNGKPQMPIYGKNTGKVR